MGDVPTWVAAIAAWAGVVVNALIVLVALSPIRDAKRERAARGRLVAAYLAFPMAAARMTLEVGQREVETLLKPDTDLKTQDAAMKRLGDLPEGLRELLNRFSVSEAAYLGEGMGEKLAESFAAVSAATMAVPRVINVFTIARKLDNVGTGKEGQAYREDAREMSAPVLEMFKTAVARLSVFTDYCESLGFLGTTSKP